jgi:sugar (pentulose or hexulose) kinase
MVADIFDLPVYALTTTDQAAIGAALIAYGGVREANVVETAQRWSRFGEVSEPNPPARVRYEETYELFREAYAPVIEVSYRLADQFAASAGPRVVPRPIRKRS